MRATHDGDTHFDSGLNEHHDGQGHGHGHERIKRVAKVLIALECPYALHNYYFRYMLGVKGSFYAGFDADTWIFYTNISVFAASLCAVILGVITDSFFQKYLVLVVTYILCLFSSVIIFAVSVFEIGTYGKLLNAIGLFWGCLFITVEPLRVSFFFDQLPTKMNPHQSGHVFLMYQEMRTVGSVIYTILNVQIGGKVYGKTPLPLAIIYFVLPLMYGVAILVLWKVANRGEFSYSIGVDCITCFLRAFHLKFFKRVKQEGHWLDTARDAYDARTVRSTKIMSSMIFVFITLISYGMALVLMKNSWSDQSQNLIEDLTVKKYYKDFNTVYFFLTIVLLPFIEYFLLPQIYKRRKDGKPFTELQRIGVTMFLTGAAFVMTTTLQLEMEKHSSILPSGSRSQVRLYNVQDENVIVSGDWIFEPTNVSKTNMIQAWNLKSESSTLYTITVVSQNIPPSGNASINYTSLMATSQGESISYLLGSHELLRVHQYDPIVFGPPGTNQLDQVRMYVINYWITDQRANWNLLTPGQQLRFKNLNGQPQNDLTIKIPPPFERKVFQLHPGNYTIVCPRPTIQTNYECKPNDVTILRGAIYAILPLVEHQTHAGIPLEFQVFKLYVVNNPAYYSVYLMLPQVIVLAFAVAMGKIPINLFLFKESPREIRVSSLALYYFSQDGSLIIFAMFSEVFRFHVDSFQLVLVTGIHMVFCFFFIYAALKHQKFPEDDGIRRRRAILGGSQ